MQNWFEREGKADGIEMTQGWQPLKKISFALLTQVSNFSFWCTNIEGHTRASRKHGQIGQNKAEKICCILFLLGWIISILLKIKIKKSFHSTEADKWKKIACDNTIKPRTLQRGRQKWYTLLAKTLQPWRQILQPQQLKKQKQNNRNYTKQNSRNHNK